MQKISENLAAVVSILNDHQLHKPSLIAEQLGVASACVKNMVKKLQAYNIPVEYIKEKGYILTKPLILLDQKKIKYYLQAKSIAIELFEQIDSTNQYLKRVACASSRAKVCIAEAQTQGRGRFDRVWQSPFGQNIYLSFCYPFYQELAKLWGLSLVVGLVVCRVMEKICRLPQPLLIKWPNDIMGGHKKLAGSLIEIQTTTRSFCHVIVGIGINVNMQHDKAQHINQHWTSLTKLSGNYYDRNRICGALIDELVDTLERFGQYGFKDFLVDWQAKDYLLGKLIRLRSNQATFEGKSLGVDQQGQLILKLLDGTKKAFSFGDTTLLSLPSV